MHGYTYKTSMCNIPSLFLYFLRHPYILTIFGRNVFMLLVSVLFMDHELGIMIYECLKNGCVYERLARRAVSLVFFAGFLCLKKLISKKVYKFVQPSV